MEKNPTIVNFPVKGIDFGDFLSSEAKEKYKGTSTSYDLVANVVHEGQPSNGIYKAHVLHKGNHLFVENGEDGKKKILNQYSIFRFQ